MTTCNCRDVHHDKKACCPCGNVLINYIRMHSIKNFKDSLQNELKHFQKDKHVFSISVHSITVSSADDTKITKLDNKEFVMTCTSCNYRIIIYITGKNGLMQHMCPHCENTQNSDNINLSSMSYYFPFQLRPYIVLNKQKVKFATINKSNDDLSIKDLNEDPPFVLTPYGFRSSSGILY